MRGVSPGLNGSCSWGHQTLMSGEVEVFCGSRAGFKK